MKVSDKLGFARPEPLIVEKVTLEINQKVAPFIQETTKEMNGLDKKDDMEFLLNQLSEKH